MFDLVSDLYDFSFFVWIEVDIFFSSTGGEILDLLDLFDKLDVFDSFIRLVTSTEFSKIC